MIVPNKFIPLDKSILSKLNYLMLEDVEEISISELMQATNRKFTDIGEFIVALDVLFVLGKIELDKDKEIIRYVS